MAFCLYKAKAKDWLVFCLGLFTMIKLRLLGTFGVSELIMAAILLFTAKENPFFKNKYARILFVLALLWAFGTLITDLYRVSNSVDLIKGLFSILFLVLILPVGYWCLYDKIERILYYMCGLGISAIIGFTFQQSTELDEVGVDVWQVYAFEYFAVFVASLMFYRGKSVYGYFVLWGYGFWSLFHLSRNIFLLFVLSSVLIAVTKLYWTNKCKARHIAQTKFNRGFFILLVILSISFIGIKNSYEHLASNGSLGERAKTKYEMQKNSSMGLISGRGDFFVSMKMIKESPIIGYGSYAKDKDELAFQKSKELGFKHTEKYSQYKVRHTLIPGHSHILGTWVYNGVLGVPFWIYALWLIFRFFRRDLYVQVKVSPLLTIWSAIMVWNILFSPFANRPVIVMFLSALLVVGRQSGLKLKKSMIRDTTKLATE